MRPRAVYDNVYAAASISSTAVIPDVPDGLVLPRDRILSQVPRNSALLAAGLAVARLVISEFAGRISFKRREKETLDHNLEKDDERFFDALLSSMAVSLERFTSTSSVASVASVCSGRFEEKGDETFWSCSTL